MMINVSIVL